MTRQEFTDLKQRIREYLDEHPLERNGCAQTVGGINRWGAITEEFYIASAQVLEDFFMRHVNN